MGIAELTRNAVDVLPEGALERKLALGRPLRVKLGIDVTSPDIHVGRGIPLQRMRAFQDEGHVGVLIVGDYTTRIGDPSGRSSERPILTDEEIDANAKRYLEQAMVILDPDRTEVRYNGEWLSKLTFADVVRLTRTITVARLLERDDFAVETLVPDPANPLHLLYTGHSTITTTQGAVMHGSDSGFMDLNPPYFTTANFVTTVQIVGGTRQYAHATGQFVAPGVLDLTTGDTVGTYSATICLGVGAQ